MEEIKSNTETNKKMWIIGLVLAGALLALALLANDNNRDTSGVAGCRPGDQFSQTTGELCEETEIISCEEGEIYDKNTGELCANQQE